MPMSDPTPTLQDLVVRTSQAGTTAVLGAARAAAEAAEPYRINPIPPAIGDLLPSLSELVSGWFAVAERVLGQQKELALDLAELVQPVTTASTNGAVRRSGGSQSHSSKAAVSASA